MKLAILLAAGGGSLVSGVRPEGYPGDEGVKLSELLADRGALLQRNLTVAADRCSDELVEFFQGAD
jgi:hypothetical protein